MKIRNAVIPSILIGNKEDLRSDKTIQCISKSEGNDYANTLSSWSNFDVKYLETSAKTGNNIESIFHYLTEEIDIFDSVQTGS